MMEFGNQWVVSLQGHGLNCKLKPQSNICCLVVCDDRIWQIYVSSLKFIPVVSTSSIRVSCVPSHFCYNKTSDMCTVVTGFSQLYLLSSVSCIAWNDCHPFSLTWTSVSSRIVIHPSLLPTSLFTEIESVPHTGTQCKSLYVSYKNSINCLQKNTPPHKFSPPAKILSPLFQVWVQLSFCWIL